MLLAKGRNPLGEQVGNSWKLVGNPGCQLVGLFWKLRTSCEQVGN